MKSNAFLTLNFTKTYPEFQMQLETEFQQGEFFSLVGPSGCGKTTLLRLIAGLEQPDRGSIKLQGKELIGIAPADRRIGLVFQDYALFPHLSVAANIAYGLKTQRYPKAEREERVAELLALFELTELAGRDIQQLSGGEKQRVAIARALAPQPEVLLLDEPFSALDYELRRRLHVDLKKYQRLLDITTIFVTHQQEEALAISDRIGVMQHGKLLQVGAPVAVYHNPVNRFVAGFLGEVNLLPCQVSAVPDTSGCYEISCNRQLQFGYKAAKSLAPGAYVLMIRPEDCHLVENSDQADGRGRLLTNEFLGALQRLKLAVGAVELTILSGREGKQPQLGEEVFLRIDPLALRLLPPNF